MKKGSTKHNEEWIPISSTSFDKKEFLKVLDTASTHHFFNDVSKVEKFEDQLKISIETDKEVVCLSSGTAAIHLALLLAGVQKDDYVLCQSFTYIASVNPVLYIGAKPIFIDSNHLDWNLDIDLLEEAIADLKKKNIHPKALIAVNNYGMPSDIVRIQKICEQEGIELIEDAAESLGSAFNHTFSGTKGSYGVFSFNNNKIFSTGGGGALVCKDTEEKNKALYLASQARVQGTGYTHHVVGYNYRLSNIQATLGLSQLSSLNQNIEQRIRTNQFYQGLFKNTQEVEVFKEPSKSYQSNHWLTCILVKTTDTFDKNKLQKMMYDHFIETRPLWKPMHLQPLFKNTLFYSNGISDKFLEQGLCLPSGSNLTDSDLSRIATVIEEFLS